MRTALVAACALGLAFSAPGTATAADTCPNAQLRTGASANLPDCRAYELVTPPDTNGVPPYGGVGQSVDFVTQNGPAFNSPLAAANGDSYLFSTPASPLPGTDAPGYGNQYRAQRGSAGWSTSLWGPNGVQAGIDQPGGFSADHGYWSFRVDHFEGRYSGTLDLNNSIGEAQWIRYPDGSMHLVGEGTIPASPDTDGYPDGFADDSMAAPDWISPDGGHIVFDTDQGSLDPHVQLTPDAPPTGTPAVYDRTPAGLHVVSLLPGDVTPTGASSFEGASTDGSTVLFGNQGKLYARVDGTSTYPVADGSALPLNGTVTCAASPADSAARQFQWLRNGAPIPGATNSTYRATAADAGDVIQCQAFVLNANAGATDVSRPGVVVAPAPTVPAPVVLSEMTPPAQSGVLTVGGAGGQTLTCDNGTWSGSPTFSYQWFRNAEPLSGNGADTNTYTVQAADVATPAVFQCAVTATNGSGAATEVSPNVDTSPAPSPAAPIVIAQTSNAIPSPGGVSDDGSKVFYAQAGNLYSFDIGTQQTIPITASGDAKLVQPSPDGSHVYFISPSQLDGSKGTQGADNLYVWDGSTTTFVATVDPGDLNRLRFCSASCDRYGLTTWAQQPLGAPPDPATNGVAAEQASRVTPGGTKLLFESEAQLTSYDNGGHFELYRYDATDQKIDCVSCNPAGTRAAGDARLLDYDFHFIGSYTTVANMSDDGKIVFFESSDALLPQDSNGVEDVYEWEADGAGSCDSSAQNGGCLFLISSGKSSQPSFITGATPDGSNVFVFTADRLVDGGQEPGVPGIYDVRVDGGFPTSSTSSAPCVGDACQAGPSAPPPGPVVASVTFSGPGNALRPPRARVLTQSARGAHFVLRVRVPTGGLVTITGSGISSVRHSLPTAGTYSLHLRLTARAQRTLRRHHRLRLRLSLAYASGSGPAQTTTVRLTVRPDRRHIRGHHAARTHGGAR